MTAPAPASRDRYWIVVLARAVVALIPAAIITFNNHYLDSVDLKVSYTAAQEQAWSDHLATLGLLSFGAFAIASGVIVGFGVLLNSDKASRPLFIVNDVLSVAAGIVAIVFSGSGLGVFLYTVSVWAVLTGFIELYSGLRARKRIAIGRDWIAVGAFTVVLAIVLLLIPADAVLAIGLFGGYAAIVGVYLAIGGFSLRWGTQKPTTAPSKGVPA